MDEPKYRSKNDISFSFASRNINEMAQEFLTVLASTSDPFKQSDYEKVFEILEELRLRADDFPDKIADLKKIVEREKKREEDEYIHIYTDKEGLEDGILMNISSLGLIFNELPVNRITTNLYYCLEEKFDSDKTNDKAKAIELKNVLKEKFSKAYLKGGVWQVPPGCWLMENELNGWTLMLPEDY